MLNFITLRNSSKSVEFQDMSFIVIYVDRGAIIIVPAIVQSTIEQSKYTSKSMSNLIFGCAELTFSRKVLLKQD